MKDPDIKANFSFKNSDSPRHMPCGWEEGEALMSWFITDTEMVVQTSFFMLSLLMCADFNPFLVFSQASEEDVF